MGNERIAAVVLSFEHKGHTHELRAFEPRYEHQSNDEMVKVPTGVHFLAGADTTSIDMCGITIDADAFRALRDIASVVARARVTVDGGTEEMDGVFYVDTLTFRGGKPRACKVGVVL